MPHDQQLYKMWGGTLLPGERDELVQIQWYWYTCVSKNSDKDTAIDDLANALFLREDLYRAFDKLQFVFISKANGVLVTHVLEETIQLRNLYHNTSLHQACVGPHFLFAHLAWAFCSFLTGFLQRSQRPLLRFATKQEKEWAKADQCRELGNNTFGQSKGCGQTEKRPTKRFRQHADVEDIEELKEDAAGGSKRKKDPGLLKGRRSDQHSKPSGWL